VKVEKKGLIGFAIAIHVFDMLRFRFGEIVAGVTYDSLPK